MQHSGERGPGSRTVEPGAYAPARRFSKWRIALVSKTLSNLILCSTLLITPSAAKAQKPKATPETEAGMVPMDQVGPRSIGVNPKSYAQLVRGSADEKHKTVS